jgi:hypothetical protein
MVLNYNDGTKAGIDLAVLPVLELRTSAWKTRQDELFCRLVSVICASQY